MHLVHPFCLSLASLFVPLLATQAATLGGAPLPEGVQSVSMTLHDASRDKSLPIRVVYPGDAESKGARLPVIVFSHGMYGSKDTYSPLAGSWAQAGFVVIQPTHGDSITLIDNPRKLIGLSRRELTNAPEAIQHWRSRPADVSFVIDSLASIEEQVPALAGRVDRERIGVGGHSFGAHTAMLIGGVSMKTGPFGRRVRFEDPRPCALLLISPQGLGGPLDEESFAGVTRPTLVVTGSEDASARTGMGADWRLGAYEAMPDGLKELVYLQGAAHNFGGITGVRLPGSGEQSEELVRRVCDATTDFWKRRLTE